MVDKKARLSSRVLQRELVDVALDTHGDQQVLQNEFEPSAALEQGLPVVVVGDA